MKIVGNTVGMGLPKPNLKQTDPRKGDFVKGKDEIPTKVSQLENDSGYLTEHQDISGKLDADKLPEAVNDALAQAKASGEFDGKDGVDGKDGQDGYTPQKNVDYFDGQPGKDGSNGADGKDGTSVTVKSVSESTADGGSNVVTFSDGKTVTIKNGSKGSTGSNGSNGVSATHSWSGTTLTVTSASGTSSANLKGEKGDKGDKGDTGSTGAAGKTPVKGTDYFTAADQEAIVQQTLIALGKPVVGEVDANKNIKLVGTLAKGVYSVKYESDDGSLVDVGQIEIGGIAYTNLVPTAEAYDSTSPYNGTGYKNGYYVSGSAPFEGTDTATVLTGYMPYTIPATGLPGTIYISGAEVQNISHCRIYFFGNSKTMTGSGVQGTVMSTYFTIETLPNGVTKLTPIASGDTSKLVSDGKAQTATVYFRMSLVGTGENLIITVNEPIE